MEKAWLCVIGLLLHLVSISLSFELIRGVFSRQNLLVQRNRTMSVNCTITEGDASSEDLYFHFGADSLAEFTHVVDNRTAELVWTPTQRANGANIFCYLRGYVFDNSTQYIAMATITIADPPQPPVIQGCINHNFVRMVCTWLPANQDELTGLKTTQTLYYSIRCGKHFYNCPSQVNNTCTTTFYLTRSHLGLYVVVNNSLAEVNSGCRNTPVKVKTSPVLNLHAAEVGNTTVRLRWTSPIESSTFAFTNKIIYQTTYISQWYSNNNQDSMSFNTSAAYHLLSSLHPATSYSITVKVLPEEGGYWSEPRSLRVTTREGVPGAAPRLDADSFIVAPANKPDKRMVHIFWQLVPIHLRHGVITGHQVECRRSSQLEYTECAYVAGSAMGAELELDVSTDYDVHVRARTTVGFNRKLHLITTKIHRQEDILPGPDEIIATRNGSLVSVTWSPVEGATSYRVHWCQSNAVNTRMCQTEIQSEAVSVTWWTVQLSPTYPHMVAVSVQAPSTLHPSLLTTSGMHSADCIHSIHQDMEPPVRLWTSSLQAVGSVSLQWTKPPCHKTAYISAYIIYYCPQHQCAADSVLGEMRVGKEEDSAVVRGLDQGTTYTFYMRSSTQDQLSAHSINVTYKVLSEPTSVVAWVVPLSLILGALFIIGVLICFRKVRDTIKKALWIEVRPPASTFRPQSDSCETQLTGADYYDYHRGKNQGVRDNNENSRLQDLEPMR